MVSRIRIAKYRHVSSMPHARQPWLLDAGGYSELSVNGLYSIPFIQYAGEAKAWSKWIGKMEYATIQDWMCEPNVLALTKRTVAEHQELTINSYVDLKTCAPEVPWLPVLQGWEPSDYFAHVAMYLARGIDLSQEPLVGVGSICRRTDTDDAEVTLAHLGKMGLKLHAFGLRVAALKKIQGYLKSADSMAWSYMGRNMLRPDHGHKAVNCSNCIKWALEWREKVMGELACD
jgi:hypothetical protein